MRRDFPQVLALLLEAARGGEPSATLQLAMLLPDGPGHGAMRSGLIRVAAAAGQPTARLLAERLTPAPAGPLPDWEDMRSRVTWPHERPRRRLGGRPYPHERGSEVRPAGGRRGRA
ncbi:MAG: hypothetical protein ACK5Y8_18830 [Betaproteobacteria bacterium]|nr:hypothetical protein [Rubrivivax sp.]